MWLFLCERVNVCLYLSKQGGLERLFLDLVAQSRLESFSQFVLTLWSQRRRQWQGGGASVSPSLCPKSYGSSACRDLAEKGMVLGNFRGAQVRRILSKSLLITMENLRSFVKASIDWYSSHLLHGRCSLLHHQKRRRCVRGRRRD